MASLRRLLALRRALAPGAAVAVAETLAVDSGVRAAPMAVAAAVGAPGGWLSRGRGVTTLSAPCGAASTVLGGSPRGAPAGGAPFALRAVTPSVPPRGARGAKTGAHKLRKGMVFEFKGKAVEVTSCTHTQGRARQSGNVQVEFRDVLTGIKGNEKFSPDDMVDTVHVNERKLQYLYSESQKLILMDPDTFEQLEVDVALAGDDAKWIHESVPVHLSLIDGAIVSVGVPERIEMVIASAGANNKGAKSDGKNVKLATLENGIELQVPGYMEDGDLVVVDTATSSYVKRVGKAD